MSLMEQWRDALNTLGLCQGADGDEGRKKKGAETGKVGGAMGWQGHGLNLFS